MSTPKLSSQNQYNVGFFCTDASYLIYHLLGIAIDLIKRKETQVYIFSTTKNSSLIRKILAQNGLNNINIAEFDTDIISQKYPSIISLIPKRIYRRYITKANKRSIVSMDAFIVPSYDYLFLKKVTPNVLLIFSDHGISNRKYSFDDRIKNFDLFFLTGNIEKNIRSNLGQLNQSNYVTCGFLKYDLVKNNPSSMLFSNRKKTILYNPHYDNKFSSFNKFGFRLLDYFSQSPDYNLIFAPHKKLISRKSSLKKRINKFANYSNIIVDFESEMSNDMTFTKYADLYLGDISSQALEYNFLESRPCLFLDAHNINSDPTNRPLSWNLGRVTKNIRNFDVQLSEAFSSHKAEYRKIQNEMNKAMFNKTDKAPSAIAVEAIFKLLTKKNKNDMSNRD